MDAFGVTAQLKQLQLLNCCRGADAGFEAEYRTDVVSITSAQHCIPWHWWAAKEAYQQHTAQTKGGPKT